MITKRRAHSKSDRAKMYLNDEIDFLHIPVVQI